MNDHFFTDSHAHVDYPDYDAERSDMLMRARMAGVRRILNIVLGPEKEKFEKGLLLFEGNPDVAIAVGIHPHDVSKMNADSFELLKSYASRPSVSALGEVGLDFFYEHSPKALQIQRFGEFLDLALTLNLPVTIHSRDAFEDTYRLVSERNVFQKVGGVLHCFTGTAKEAEQFLDLGAFISFSGILTFKKAEALREVARAVPIDRLLIETDAPFLAPEPYRGKRNEPAFLVRTAETLASLKGMSVQEIAKVTTENAKKLFRSAWR